MRRLLFNDTNVMLYTGSIGWYRGNYYMSVRPWVSNKLGDTRESLSFMLRRYFATRDDYCTLRVGGGRTSDFDASVDQLLLSSHWYVDGEWQRRYAKYWVVRANAGYHDQNFDNGIDRQSWVVGGGIARLF